MVDENTGINVWNPDKQISEQITLKNLVLHDTAMRLARTGIPELPSEKPLSFNDRISYRFKGLNEIISAQQCIITNANPIVQENNKFAWNKKYKSDEDRLENKFEKEDNDYNELSAIIIFLDECEQKIIIARRTKSFKDDFVLEKDDNVGEVIFELSEHFFKMMKDLEESYESIYSILIKNKIVSSGISLSEEATDKEVEEEQHRRIVES